MRPVGDFASRYTILFIENQVTHKVLKKLILLKYIH